MCLSRCRNAGARPIDTRAINAEIVTAIATMMMMVIVIITKTVGGKRKKEASSRMVK